MEDFEIILKPEDRLIIDPTNRSLYDYSFKSYSIVPLQKEASSNVQSAISKILDKNNISKLQLIQKLLQKTDTELVANLTNEAKAMIEKGEWSLGLKKESREILAMIKDNATGKIKSQVTLVEKNLPKDLGTLPTLAAMQMQLAEISEKIEELNHNVLRVEEGQYNDRYAGFYTGRQLTIEALSSSNEQIRTNLLLEAIKINNETISKLMLSVHSNIKPLQDPKIKKAEAERLTNFVETSLGYINSSVQLNMVAYTELHEQQALVSTMINYESFLNQTLLYRPNKQSHSAAWLIDNGLNRDVKILEVSHNITRKIRETVEMTTQNQLTGGKPYVRIQENMQKSELQEGGL